MTYARARLYLGISCVGMWVVLSVFLLSFRLPERLLATTASPSIGDVYQLLGIVFAYAFIQGAFDLFGGHILPREYGRSDSSLRHFLPSWFRGAALHGVFLFVGASTLLNASRVGGFALALLLFVLLNLVLLQAQVGVARLVGGLRLGSLDSEAQSGRAASPLLLGARHRYFTGGVSGLPGRARIVLPEAWRSDLSRASFEALLERKEELVRRGAYARGVLLALGWNTLGFCVAYAAAGTTAHVAGLVSFSLWSTLWAFAGVLVLPTPSRVGVFMGDLYALGRGADATVLAESIRELERNQDDEVSRSRGVETVFHPIPSVKRRLAALEARGQNPPKLGRWAPWHAARLALYLSWANLSLLSRAVHCNIGRPEVWVFLPSD